MPWHGKASVDAFGVGSRLRSLLQARAGLAQLHASVSAEVLDPRDPGVLLVLRRHPLGPMLGAYNVTDRPGEVPVDLLHHLGLGDRPYDHVSGTPLHLDGAPTLRLPPYTPLWLTP